MMKKQLKYLKKGCKTQKMIMKMGKTSFWLSKSFTGKLVSMTKQLICSTINFLKKIDPKESGCNKHRSEER